MLLAQLLLPWAILAAPPNLQPVATVGEVDRPPVIDGAMGDPCWQQSAVAAPFVLLGTADLPTQQTVVRVCHDDNNIYVGFWCWEDDIADLRTEAKTRDSEKAWSDDCVEVFLAPGGPANVYYHIIVTAAGVVTDERAWQGGARRDMSWNFGGQAATGRWPRGWTCELAIPRRNLGDAALTGTWAASFARGEHPHGEWSSWPSLIGGFHEVSRFGKLRWADKPAVTGLSIGPVFIGRNLFRMSFASGETPPQVEAVIVRGGVSHRKRVETVGDDKAVTLAEEGEGYLRILAVAPSAAPSPAPGSVSAGEASTEGGSGPPQASTKAASETSGEAAQTASAAGQGSTPQAAAESRPGPAKPPKVLFATPPIHFAVTPISPILAKAYGYLNAARAAADSLPSPRGDQVVRAIRAAYTQASEVGQDLALAKVGTSPSLDDWDALAQRARDLDHDSFLLLAQARTLVRAGSSPVPGFALGWQDSLVKLLRDDTRVNLAGPITLSACRGEGESAQIVAVGLDQPSHVEKVTVSPLKLEGSDVELPASATHIYRVGYVHTRTPVYPVDYVGWWPDPLMPNGPCDVAAGELQPYWITVYVPRDARPGIYRGRVWVRGATGKALSWPLQLHVWDLTLPWPSRLKTAFSMLPGYDAARWYGWKGLPPKSFRMKLYKLLFEHRLNPASIYSSEMWPPREDLDWCVKNGLNALNIRNVSSADPQVLSYVKDQADWLKQRGWLPLAYIYGFDEVQPPRWPALREAYAAVKKEVPALKRACTVVPNPDLTGYVDIWVPLTASFDPGEARKRQKAGDEVWWYICCGPWHPYCNWFIDYPATDARVLFWQTYKYHVTGFLYYEIAMWRTNLITQPSADLTQIPPASEAARKAIAEGKRWPDVPWNTFTFSRYNGDGLLIYPGPDETPLPSLRLEVIRDGIEDYDLLSLLGEYRRELLKSPRRKADRHLIALAGMVDAVRPRVTRDLTHYTHNPEVILRERDAVARMALALKAALRK